MTYRPKYFCLHELVPESLYDTVDHAVLWGFFDDRILIAADIIREAYGPMVINNWHVGGGLQYCGFRPWDCKDGAAYSQHKFGRALDLHPVPSSEKVVEIRYRITTGEICAGLVTCVEDGVDWLHIDCRLPEGNGKIKVVHPQTL